MADREVRFLGVARFAMGLVVTSAPSVEPLTRAQAKRHLNVPDTFVDDDSYIDRLIVGARRRVESITGRALVTQTIRWTLDGFPCHILDLPRAPLASVSSVTYYDANGTLTTMSASDYQVDASSLLGRLSPAPSTTWPTTQAEKLAAVAITFVAGYGDADAVPEDLKDAMRLLIGTAYAFREDTISGTIVAKLPRAAEDLVAPYRIPTVLVPMDALAA